MHMHCTSSNRFCRKRWITVNEDPSKHLNSTGLMNSLDFPGDLASSREVAGHASAARQPQRPGQEEAALVALPARPPTSANGAATALVSVPTPAVSVRMPAMDPQPVAMQLQPAPVPQFAAIPRGTPARVSFGKLPCRKVNIHRMMPDVEP